ncbi:MAG TPA: GNAT family N-acetyltransferase [Burkholderiaceae bacterium]|jgi:ribosomal-protein-alanine N-acetyltransferase|nr:GNAT family N-acetyltransferase [Burkholderiaceae bacterium]
MPHTLQTERLILRPFTEDDAEEYFPLASHPDVLRYTGESPKKSVAEVRQLLLDRPIRHYAVHGYSRMACIEKSSGRLIGFSGLKYVDELKDVDIGYRFVPDCWGKGYATESARFLMQEGIREFKFKRIIGMAEPENVGSTNVLKKLGLKFERHFTMDGDPTELALYALTTEFATELE